ncbi:hypothetical protein DERP_009256 [Dermatophagoides pteronyssinus]|uniref:Uncharacterized protein n=1 Tax=Dermatophagoides pteronyssinus TaxID=6956 RepID=A0ABQ8JQZ0_DERPT|nr:hypothetical protein DERP_009256 [Dermatophagoides pteronyssinus]
MIIVFVLRECLFYHHLFELIKYKSKITEFLMKYCQYDDCELSFEYQNHLIQFYKKSINFFHFYLYAMWPNQFD